MKVFNIKMLVVCSFLFVVPLNSIAQSLNLREQTFQYLNILLDQRDHHEHIGWVARADELKQKGVDVIAFSNQILKDEVFVDYREDALFLLATQKYNTEPEFLAEFIINDYRVNQNKSLPGYLHSNVQCLNILQALSTPSFLGNENIKSSIISFTDELLRNDLVIDPNFWIERSDLTTLASLNNDSITREQKDLLNTADTKARLCLGLIAFSFYATEEDKYLNTLKNALESNNQMIMHSAKYFLSSQAKQRWQEGRYELFAVERGIRQHSSPIIKSKEEVQGEIESSLRARNKSQNN